MKIFRIFQKHALPLFKNISDAMKCFVVRDVSPSRSGTTWIFNFHGCLAS
jgi:hypothetical protein